MAKIKSEEKNEEAVISREMVEACKKEIIKFEKYPEFLISVGAMKENGSVVKYPNTDMEKYREMFLKKNEHSIGDSFQIDKTKIHTSDHNGNKFQTGWFVPRVFWDKICELG